MQQTTAMGLKDLICGSISGNALFNTSISKQFQITLLLIPLIYYL